MRAFTVLLEHIIGITEDFDLELFVQYMEQVE